MIPVLAGLVQMGLLSVLFAEIVAYFWLFPSYVTKLQRFSSEVSLPVVADPSQLTGTTHDVSYRWDPDSQLLLFGRRWGVAFGERGHMCGTVRFTETGTEIKWRPAPLFIIPMFLLFAVMGAIGLVVVEGNPIAVVIVPASMVVTFAIGAMQVFQGRRTLERLILPQLAAAIEANPR